MCEFARRAIVSGRSLQLPLPFVYEGDCPPKAPRSVCHYEGEAINEFVIKDPLPSGGINNRTLPDPTKCQEHLRIDTALCALKRCRCAVYDPARDESATFDTQPAETDPHQASAD